MKRFIYCLFFIFIFWHWVCLFLCFCSFFGIFCLFFITPLWILKMKKQMYLILCSLKISYFKKYLVTFSVKTICMCLYFNFIPYFAFLTFLLFSVTFVQETRVRWKYKISIRVSMMSLFVYALILLVLLYIFENTISFEDINRNSYNLQLNFLDLRSPTPHTIFQVL